MVNSLQIPVLNLEKAKDFYSGIFNWHVYPEESMPNVYIYQIDKEGEFVGGGFVLRESVNQEGNSILLYVNADDVEKTLSDVTRLGGTPVGDIMKLPGGHGTIAQFRDPFGNLIGLWNEAT